MEDNLILINRLITRREQALLDSDANLAALLADCSISLLKYEKIDEVAQNILGYADAGNRLSGYLQQQIFIDRDTNLQTVFEYLDENYND